MHDETPQGGWCLTEQDEARLQPIVRDIAARLDRGVEAICRITDEAEARIRMLQGFCEALGDRMREAIMQQVDRGEWAARGITKRDELDVTITVDAARGVLDGDNLIRLSMMPTENLA